MDSITELAERLKKCPHANAKQLGERYFTTEFLENYAGGLLHAIRMTEGMSPTYQPSELEKSIIHYCVRNLIQDLWQFSIPTIKQFIQPNGRFDFKRALANRDYEIFPDDLVHNLNVGQKMIYDITSQIYDDWMNNLAKRSESKSEKDPIPLMFTLYRYHSVLIHHGNWEWPSIMYTTFTSASREDFDNLVEHPNLSRREIEEIAENSIEKGIEQASQLTIKSAAKEQVVRDITQRGEFAYILDVPNKRMIFNPKYIEEVERRESELLQEGFFDQTNLLLMCPAKFVSSRLYNKGSMIHDLLRFRNSVFVEIYLATHARR